MVITKKLLGVIGGVGLLASLTAPIAHADSQELHWGACSPEMLAPARAQCATFEAPMDYSKPNAKKITLTMSKVPATGEKRGVIAGNPGGPGGSALGMFSDAANPSKADEQRVQLPAEVQKHFDQIAVQPRGMAGGEALTCEYSQIAALGLPTMSGGTYRHLCNISQPGYIDHVKTTNTARDLDIARKRLGEDKLNLYGVSYGGFLMATYATMFPQHTDRTVLDGSVAPKDFIFKTGRKREAWRRDSLHELFQWIADRDSQYHLGKTPLQVYQKWSKVIDKETGSPAQVTPPPAEVGDLPAGLREHAGTVLPPVNHALPAAWRLSSAVIALSKDKQMATAGSPLFNFTYMPGLYNESMRPVIAEYIKTGKPPKELTGEVGPHGRPINSETGEEFTEKQLLKLLELQGSQASVELAIVCNDNATPVRPDLLPQLHVDRLTGGDTLAIAERGLGSGELCAGWPLPKPGPRITGDKLQTKPLHLGFEHDSAVTGDAIWGMQKAMGGKAIQIPGYSHGVLAAATDQVAKQVSDYYLRGE